MEAENEPVSFNHLLNSILQTHKSKKDQNIDSVTGVQHVDYSDSELTTLVQVLWNDRYTSSREEFKNAVSEVISKRINDIET
jgi:hypothetical protein